MVWDVREGDRVRRKPKRRGEKNDPDGQSPRKSLLNGSVFGVETLSQGFFRCIFTRSDSEETNRSFMNNVSSDIVRSDLELSRDTLDLLNLHMDMVFLLE